MSVNKVTLIGNVGKEPVINNFEFGTVANFTLATTRKGFQLQNGKQFPDKTTWHNIKVNNGLTKVVGQYVHKGDKLYIEGEIETRQYEKNGVTMTITEILVHNMELLTPRQQSSDIPYAEQIPEDRLPPF